MIKAYIYARYSSHNQQEKSIEEQIKDCQKYADEHDVTVLRTYADKAISGKTDNRADFQRMISDVEKGGGVDCIIVYKMDRFARNRYDSALYKSLLKKRGVKVLSAKEAIPDSPEGVILEAIIEGYAEYYSLNLAQHVRRGMEGNANKTLSNGGTTPLGFKVNKDREYEIDEPAAAVVRQIFVMYSSGKTVTEIISYLNEKGFKTAKSLAFTKNSLYHLLRNKKYIGVYTWNGIETPGALPQIIDVETFNKVQNLIGKPTHRTKVEREPFLLTYKLFCGKCGAFMIGDSGKSKSGDRHYYYTCSKKKNHKSCTKKSVRKGYIERLVVAKTVEFVLNEKTIGKIADGVIAHLAKENENSALPYYKQKISEIDFSISNILKTIEQGATAKAIFSRLEELEAERDSLKILLAKEATPVPNITHEDIVATLHSFCNGDVDDPHYRETIINLFVNSVWLYDDKIVILYNYRDGKHEFTLDQINDVVNECSDIVCNAPPTPAYPNTLVFLSGVFGVVVPIE